MMLRPPDKAVIDAADNDQSKYLTIGCGSVCFNGSPRCLKAIPERRECLAGEYRICGSILGDRLCLEMLANQFAKAQRISRWSGDGQHWPSSDINRRRACGGTRCARSPSCSALCQPARSGRLRRRGLASVRPIRLVVTPRAQIVAELPSLVIRALPTAAFKLAELVALAQFIAGAECKDRAHAYAKFAEGELRVSRQ